jgi:hydroxypyruvate isomerase
MKLAANLTLLCPGQPPETAVATAREAGFAGVEVLFPYDHAPGVWHRALGQTPLVLINTPAGDWAAGERGFAAVPGAEARFRDDFHRALDMAAATGAGRLHVMAGNAQGAAAARTFAANLHWALDRAGTLPLTIEPLNPGDMPGYFLNDFDQAARILADLDRPGIGLQFDLWHAARLEPDPLAIWHRVQPRVSHVQIAGLASRAEPCAAARVFCDRITDAGYGGWISAEYRPTPGAGFDWCAQWRAADLARGGRQG